MRRARNQNNRRQEGHRLRNTNDEPARDAQQLVDLNISDKEEEPRNEEDYDPASLEESKERSETQFYDEGEREEMMAKLTVTPANAQNTYQASKMFMDAVDAKLETALTLEQEAKLISRDNEDARDKSYGFGRVGQNMQKRTPLREPYE